MRKTDYELLNELYHQNVSEAIPAVVGAIGRAAGGALADKAVDTVADTMAGAAEDPRMIEADTDFNDTSNELGDKLKSANVEMFSDMIAKAIEELINSTTDDNSPLGKKDCVDMIMASAQRYLDEGSCNRH